MQAACYAIQNGATLSRAQVKFFKHNDMEDLERLLQEQAAKDKRSKYGILCNIRCKSSTAGLAIASMLSSTHMGQVALICSRGRYNVMYMV